MGKRLYVGNLPFSVEESALRSLFEGEGRQVEDIHLVTDRDTGRPRGFGFVEMATDEQAESAIGELNGYELQGRPLTVNVASARAKAPASGPCRSTTGTSSRLPTSRISAL